uniref:Transcription factor CBF/NF-Y/histone domain-containing protein n=1 Tax=uncultured marine thaumarchaeote AD1000_06_A03 TaxID=1455884 RepID=A0A075FMJ7_9ARCH|nr:transcription factor CBF/NF-Y/histone domain-containing protein [uncultured marine thaumarchaeote AD1000_06_A03]|tara:strand:- start:92 stop:316 length:225 start_codon:yes stop_codon:yes gene_type:complete
MSDLEFGLAAVYRIIKKTGAERVGDDAAEELRTVLEEFGIKIAEQALVYAKHAGRKTVKSSDIRLAVDEINKKN